MALLCRVERRIKAAKRAARSELSVTKGEWWALRLPSLLLVDRTLLPLHALAVFRMSSLSILCRDQYGLPLQAKAWLCKVQPSVHRWCDRQSRASALPGMLLSAKLLCTCTLFPVSGSPVQMYILAKTTHALLRFATPAVPQHMRRFNVTESHLQRLVVQDLSVEQFVERFERPRLPVVISGLCDSWKGQEKWTEENLVKHYGEHKFKVCVRSRNPRQVYFMVGHPPLYAHYLPGCRRA